MTIPESQYTMLWATKKNAKCYLVEHVTGMPAAPGGGEFVLAYLHERTFPSGTRGLHRVHQKHFRTIRELLTYMRGAVIEEIVPSEEELFHSILVGGLSEEEARQYV